MADNIYFSHYLLVKEKMIRNASCEFVVHRTKSRLSLHFSLVLCFVASFSISIKDILLDFDSR